MIRNDKANALARDMRNVVSEVETLLRDANSAGSGTMQDLRNRVGLAMEAARDRLDRLDSGARGARCGDRDRRIRPRQPMASDRRRPAHRAGGRRAADTRR